MARRDVGERSRRLPLFEVFEPRRVLAADAVISEFMSDNDGRFVDGDGNSSDWIEIHNPGDQGLDLSGWHLTDDPRDLTKFTFPQVTLESGAFIVVFASGLSSDDGGLGYVDAAGHLHANFKLSSRGEFLALVQPNGETVASSFGEQFPTQREGVAYGIDQSPDGALRVGYLLEPTPRQPNGRTVLGYVDDVQFDLERGFYEQSFDVAISSQTSDATIVVTTDGSIPTLENGVQFHSDGQISTASIRVETTTTLRAAAFKEDLAPTEVETHTYIFIDDVVRQPASRDDLPRRWDGISQSAIRADYEMDPTITEDPDYRADLTSGLREIPTISLVLDNEDMFGDRRGIYVNSGQRGHRWERPTSVEIIEPDGTTFQVDSGVRIHGFSWRFHSNTPKHSFRLEFRNEYGPTKLEYPLFPDAPVDRFDSIVLRAQGGRAWAGLQNPNQAQYLRDTFARDLSREMGRNDGHATLVHLYINGLYWGLYNPVERPDAQMGEEYFGGTQDDYDALNRRTSSIEIIDGDSRRYREMMGIVNDAQRRGSMIDEEYDQLQRHLAMDEFIDFMIVNQYVTNRDGLSAFEGNNQRAIGSRVGDAQFRFYVWDMEYSLWNATDNNNVDVNRPALAGSQNPGNGVWAIYKSLRLHPEFRLRYADRVQRHLFNEGALTPDNAAATWETRANSIENAVVAESARWGDAKRSTPYTRDREWQAERTRLLRSYFPRRAKVLAGHLEAVGLYTRTEVPHFVVSGQPQHGGKVEKGDTISLKQDVGSFARDRDFVVADSVVSAYVPMSDRLEDRWTVPTFSEGAAGESWVRGQNGVGYDNSTDYGQFVNVDVGPQMQSNSSVFIRMPFVIDDAETLDEISQLKLRLLVDDGYVAYLNGVRVASDAAPSDLQWNSNATSATEADLNNPTEVDITRFAEHLTVGNNVLAIHGLNRSIRSGDMLIHAELFSEVATFDQIWYTLDGSDPRLAGGQINNAANGGTAKLFEGDFALLETSHIRSRAFSATGAWSAMNEATFVVGTPIQITELNYHPSAPTTTELEAMPNVSRNDFEFIELSNNGDAAVSIGGAQFTDGIELTFLPVQLDVGERAVVVSDLAAFRLRYGSEVRVIGQYDGRLANEGERIVLSDAVGEVIFDFQYNDSGLWPQAADGVGASLELINSLTESDQLGKNYSWQNSSQFGGTPGFRPVEAVGVVINEVLANSDSPQLVDYVELYNASDATVYLGGWYLSDARDQLLKYKIPSGTVLASGEYLVIDERQFNAPGEDAFGLGGTAGDSVWLVEVDEAESIHRFVDDVHFGGSMNGESFGRVPNGAGRIYPNVRRTPGGPNSSHRAGQLLISEVNYHPGQPTQQALAIDKGLSETDLQFVEIHNPSGQTINVSNWRIRGGVDYEFADGARIGAGQSVVVVGFDPSNPDDQLRLQAFEAHYDSRIDTVVGPFRGELSDSFDRVTLHRENSGGNQAGIFGIEDEIVYDDSLPWPIDADGQGHSLQRRAVSSYGNDPNAWTSAAPNAGRVGFFIGDFNGDQRIDAVDIDLMCAHLGSNDNEFDVNGDGKLTLGDHEHLVRTILNTTFGDANLDGQFDSSDLVLVFRSGEYEDALLKNSGWRDGDWNCDGEFDSSDLVDAFRSGDYRPR